MEGRKIIQWGLGALAIAVVLGYSYFVLDDFVRGPRIIIESPMSGFSTTSPAIVVVGRGVHTSNLSINGAQTPVDLEGNFRGQLILAPGYNIIKITAKDNYAREVEETIEMILVVPEIKAPVATTTPETVTTPPKIESASAETWIEGAVIN